MPKLVEKTCTTQQFGSAVYMIIVVIMDKYLIHFAASREMVIGSTLFSHKEMHKGIWKAPNGQTMNQIDHRSHKPNLIDVKPLTGANIDSDHFLVLSELHARISNCKKEYGIKIKKYNIEKLKYDDITLQYKQKLDNELSKTVVESVQNTDERWSTIKKAIITMAEEKLEVVDKVKTKDWFDEECEAITETKNRAYLQMLQRGHTRQSTEECKNKRREDKQVHRKKKREHENL
jgi:hypothetical protein